MRSLTALFASIIYAVIQITVSPTAFGQAPRIDCKLLGGVSAADGRCIFPESGVRSGQTGAPRRPQPSKPPPPIEEIRRARAALWTSTTTWKWECEAGRFESCKANQDFIANPGADLCSYSMQDHSENGATEFRPPVVTELPGGINIKRYVSGDIWGRRGWFDTTVSVTVIDKSVATAQRAGVCLGNTSNIRKDDYGKDFQYRSFCGGYNDAGSGWLVVRLFHDDTCNGLEKGLNSATAVNENSVKAGEVVLVCWQQSVPNGWADLGIQMGDGACGRNRSGNTNQRKLKRL